MRNINNNNLPEMGSPVVRPRRISLNSSPRASPNKKNANKPHPANANVRTYFNKSFNAVNKKNIPANKRSFLLTNVLNNRKVRTVYDIRALKKWLNQAGVSPLTRIPFTNNNIKKYPKNLPKPLVIKPSPKKTTPRKSPKKK